MFYIFKFIVIIIIFFCIILAVYLFIKYNFCNPIYCVDELTEARLVLEGKINKLADSYSYWHEQCVETDHLFKESLTSGSKEEQKGILQAKKECEANLNNDSLMLKNLKAKLASGDFNISTTSSLGKHPRT